MRAISVIEATLFGREKGPRPKFRLRITGTRKLGITRVSRHGFTDREAHGWYTGIAVTGISLVCR
jgi:hypothetical protein